MVKIELLKAREVLDSRGNPTVEVEITTKNAKARAIVPSGASTGVHESLELRDGDAKRYNGKGVLKAVENINKKIAPKVLGKDCSKQKEMDMLMINLDGTDNKSKLGANAILAVSMAAAKAAAESDEIPLYEHLANIAGNMDFVLPVPAMNVINGGKHAGNNLSVQEFMIMPVGADNFRHAVQVCAEFYHELKKIIEEKYGKNAINVGDEGGFAPPIDKTADALELLMSALKRTGYEEVVKFGMDAAASEFYKNGKYEIDGEKLDGMKLVEKYIKLVKKYPIISIEDPFAEDDFKHFAILRQEIGESVQIVGDDLLVTNVERIKKAAKEKSVNALLLKVNQIGTVTEAIDAAKLAMKNGWGVMVSHRSGESEDSFIADLAVALKAGQIKSGAPCRGERTCKYNQLMRIEEELEGRCRYAGSEFRTPWLIKVPNKKMMSD